MSVCRECGHENREEARFCDACGTPLAAGASAPVREERKIVTVLFADLVGFTSRAEQLDPEDVRRLLQPYYQRLRTELERHGGTVEKFIGDAVMALFGAPVAHEDDAERGVRAAIAIREALSEDDSPLQVRIAVNTGEALVALGARPSEGEAMASGDVVNTAARMQSAAPVNGILVGGSTYRATKHVIEYRAAPPIEAKGKSEPVPVWEAVAPRSRFGLDVEQRPRTTLVGRERELGLLTDALDRVRREQSPQLVTLVGVPGIGKSRLVAELYQVVDRDPELIWWRQGRSLPYGESLSYWALGEIVKAQAGIAENDTEEIASAKLHETVRSTLPDPAEVDWVFSHLRPLVGLSSDAAADGDKRTEACSAWRRFFEALAEQRALVLVFEDLHWADDGLLDFIDYLADWASAVPLLIVCMARPELLERRSGWGGGKRNATTATIDALSREDTARLLAGLLEQTLLPAEIHAAVLERAEGNPLYAEEYVRMLRDRGLLTRDEGSWRLSNPSELPLPETVQGMIAARLDALRPEEKALAQDAAVVGKVFWLGTLAAMSGQDLIGVEEALHALERKEFIRRERRSIVAGERQYVFLHVLFRDVAYSQIPRSRRADRHRRTAEWIASLASDRSEDRAEMLAYHYLQALELARAAGIDATSLRVPARTALAEAGERALALNAAPTALRFSEKALELSSPDDPMRPRLQYQRALAKWWLGDQDLEPARASRDAAIAAGDLQLAAQAASVLASGHWVRGEHDLAMEERARAVSLVEGLPASEVTVRVQSEHGRTLFLGGMVEPGIAVSREALLAAEGLGLDEVASHALNTIGMARSFGGDPDGITDLDRSVELAAGAKSPDSLHQAYNNLANTLWWWGRLDEAHEQLRLARLAGERFGNQAGLRWLDGEDVFDLAARGDLPGALRRADAFVAALGPAPYYLEAPVRATRMRIRLGRGDTRGALEDAQRADELAGAVKDPQVVNQALLCRAEALSAAGHRLQAEHVLDRLLVQQPNLGDFWLRSWAFLSLRVGRAAAFLEVASEAAPTPWFQAAKAVASEHFEEAAHIYGRIGAQAEEAEARMLAAEIAASHGQRDDAEHQLALALEFFRRAGATAYVRRGETLLATTA
ncbi:MAG TPA: adenylate/guanylate cyclase domain-containing protein [Actinomycetota bacterium]|nr:adenylate/guanylate cyclase domain-containing protein [Actinomycetota bacterium]